MSKIEEKLDIYLNEVKKFNIDFKYINGIVKNQLEPAIKALKKEVKMKDASGVSSEWNKIKKSIDQINKQIK